MGSIDLVWTIVGLLLTLMIFSYIFGDNPLFRLASYLFIGVTAGYVAVLIIYQVVIPKLIWPLVIGSTADRILALVMAVLSILLFTRLIPSISNLGNLPMAYLVGSGAAVMIGGAVLGTLFTQAQATVSAFGAGSTTQPLLLRWGEGLFILGGTITTLAYFHFGARGRGQQNAAARAPIIEGIAGIGQIFIAITLGALFAGVIAASITALIERIGSLWNILSTSL